MIMKQVIIGNCAAGVSAAEVIRSVDSLCEIVIISDEEYSAYSRVATPYYIASEISEDNIFFHQKRDFYSELNLKPMLGRKVAKVEPDENRIIFTDGEELSYDNLLIATGASANIPPIKGIELEGVSVLRTLDDAKRIAKRAEAGRKAVTIGGGLVSSSSAKALVPRGLRVTMVVTSSQILSQVMDPEGASIIQRHLESKGIEIITGANVTEIVGDKEVEGVILDNGDKIECQLVIVGKGMSPNVDLIEGTEIEKGYGVFVDEHLRTNIPNIYAAGDICEVYDISRGERYISAIWPNAVKQGKIAGYNMAGEERRYEGGIRMNAGDFLGLSVISVGITRTRRDPSLSTLEARNNGSYRKVILRDNLLVGAVLIRDIRSAGFLRSLIEKRADISRIKKSLTDFNFGVAKRYNYILGGVHS